MSKPPILTPFLDDADVILYAGDCIDVMSRMPEASVDAIVTDPPYGIEFMGKDWDSPKMLGGSNGNSRGNYFKRKGDEGYVSGNASGYHRNDPQKFQAFSEAWAREAFRVLKPGGHLLAFAGTRTYHRMASGVEDAGFEIRDCIAWMYGSGFPKSKNVALAIDKGEGHPNRGRAIPTASTYQASDKKQAIKLTSNPVDDYVAQSDTSKAWSGWGTALKPAFEPIVVARKPLIGTVAQNVLEHGTGALNIDACRIGTTKDTPASASSRTGAHGIYNGGFNALDERSGMDQNMGRWPANIALDATAAEMLDQQSGERASTPFKATTTGAQADRQHVSFADLEYSGRGYTDTGGASRFFYTAKASRQDRNTSGADNTHPTVKPTELMRWLIRLVTPPNGIILDPFGGSGSTGVAARAENVRCVLIEREEEYLEIIRNRLAQQNLFATEHRND